MPGDRSVFEVAIPGAPRASKGIFPVNFAFFVANVCTSSPQGERIGDGWLSAVTLFDFEHLPDAPSVAFDFKDER